MHLPDPRRAAVVLAGAAAFVSLYAPQSLLPLLRVWMGTNAALAGLVVSAATAGVALIAPFTGWLADRYGRRRVIVMAALLSAFPTVLMAFATSPSQLIASRFLEGLVLPGIFAVTVAYIGGEWPATEARAVMALYVAGTIGGGFGGRLLAGVLAEFSGWRAAFLGLAVLQLLLAFAIRAWLPGERNAEARSRARGSSLSELFGARLLSSYAAGACILFSLIAGFTYVSLRLSEPPFRLGPAALSAVFVVYLAGVLVTPAGGRLLNALGHARVFVLVTGVAIGGLALTLIARLDVIILGLGLFSTGIFLAQTRFSALSGRLPGRLAAPPPESTSAAITLAAASAACCRRRCGSGMAGRGSLPLWGQRGSCPPRLPGGVSGGCLKRSRNKTC